MAANAAAADSDPVVVEVLFALHDKFDIMSFAGPLQVLTHALHNVKDPGMCLFRHSIGFTILKNVC